MVIRYLHVPAGLKILPLGGDPRVYYYTSAMTEMPRLDILLYAHDGRGLGHASRTIAIGMAIRRLYPGLRVALVSGCSFSRELIGNAPLDWIKLPSYETRVINGRSCGISGKSGYSDQELGRLRTHMLKDIIRLYRPRVMLVDHQPQGKHRELLQAIETSREDRTRWILGIRGVTGSVPQTRSDLAAELFRSSYHGLLWYGDSRVLGTDHLKQLRQRFGTEPVECGYVSRLAQQLHFMAGSPPGTDPPLAGTVAIPWQGEQTLQFLSLLPEVLHRLGPDLGPWIIFAQELSDPLWQKHLDSLRGLDHVRVEPISANYVQALVNSRTAVIYGGYNSVVDILQTGIPAVVLLRDMHDGEQQLHLQLLRHHVGDQLRLLPEQDVRPDRLHTLIKAQLEREIVTSSKRIHIRLDGAENSARFLHRLLKETRPPLATL
ncbi:hypothetical protein [Desulfolithobacter sp.]